MSGYEFNEHLYEIMNAEDDELNDMLNESYSYLEDEELEYGRKIASLVEICAIKREQGYRNELKYLNDIFNEFKY